MRKVEKGMAQKWKIMVRRQEGRAKSELDGKKRKLREVKKTLQKKGKRKIMVKGEEERAK